MPSNGKYAKPPYLSAVKRKELYEAQGGRCPICGGDFDIADLQIEHSHRTGALRGLVCKSDNPKMRRRNDSPKAIAAEIEYLGKMLRYLRCPPAKRAGMCGK